MKIYILYLVVVLVLFSCEKDTESKATENEDYIHGELLVGFVENAKLKSAFDLVNRYNLEIRQVYGIHYASNLPYDSLDYVVDILKTRIYFNTGRWHIAKDTNVYRTWGTGIIIIVSRMGEMNGSSQDDWALTSFILRLEEKPSEKSFLMAVPEGQEIYWRNRFRRQNMVKWAELNYRVNPWP